MKYSFAVLVATLAIGGAARAQDTSMGTFAGSLAVTSDYMFRGISQTANDPAVQGGVTWSAGNGFYAGLWGSNVDFLPGDKADVEVDFSAGYAGDIDGLTYDVGVIYYAYPGARSGANYDYWEGALKLGRAFGDVTWSGGLYYTPDNFGGTEDGVYVTTGLKYAFTEGWAVDANIGRSEINPAAGPDYWDYNIGLTYAFPGVDANIRFHDTDNAVCARLCDARVVLTLSRAF